MSEFFDDLETRSAQRRHQDLSAAIRNQVAHAKKSTSAYAGLFADIDASAVHSLDDLARLPITRKSGLIRLQENNPPFGGLSPLTDEGIRYINVSPGPIYEACSARPDFFRLARALFAAGFRKGERVHNSFSYHLTPAGQMLDSGCHALGCAVIPAGTGQTEMQVQTIHDLRPRGYVGTPSFLRILLDKADELGKDTGSLQHALVSGEALPASLRAGFKERGIRVMQAYATADLGLIAYETIADAGLIVDEGVYVEIIRPGGSEPVADGEVGEVVVTTLNPDYPLIRFATGDLSAVAQGESECGRSNKRIKGWMGRADQTAKVRGLFIHPEQIQAIVSRHPEVQKARLVVNWVGQHDTMTLHCEVTSAPDGLREAVATSIRELCRVRGDVIFVAANSIANDGIVIEDIRKYE